MATTYWQIHRVPPYSNNRCKRQLIVTRTCICNSNSNSRMRRELTRGIRQVICIRLNQSSNGHKVSIVTLSSCLVLNDKAQFQRLTIIHDHLIATQTKFQQMGWQPGQETGLEPEVTHMNVTVDAHVTIVWPQQSVASMCQFQQILHSVDMYIQSNEWTYDSSTFSRQPS
jgi:hypothetical protein